MTFTITAAQRDALYGQILDRLSGIGDIEVAIRAENYNDAKRLGREYCDDLRLLLDGLGIGEGDGEPVELTAPPEVLRRVLPRLRELALNHSAGLEPEWAEVDELRERNRLVSEACENVLIGLAGSVTGSRQGDHVPMGLFPRLRQACRRDRRGPADAAPAGTRTGQGLGAKVGAPCGHPSLAGAAGALQDQDSRLLLNHLFLSGVLVEDPQPDKSRNGEPVTQLLIAFPAPDAKGTEEEAPIAINEVEVPEQVSARHPRELRAGGAIFVTGQLSGGGGILATEIHSGPPPGSERR